jgi:hypothetical protein
MDYVKKKANMWKKKELSKVERTKNDMIINNIHINQINKYVDDEYKCINNFYNTIIKNGIPLRVSNNIKKKEINNIIATKRDMIIKGYKTEFINNYINKEYDNLNEKYNKIEFID